MRLVLRYNLSLLHLPNHIFFVKKDIIAAACKNVTTLRFSSSLLSLSTLAIEFSFSPNFTMALIISFLSFWTSFSLLLLPQQPFQILLSSMAYARIQYELVLEEPVPWCKPFEVAPLRYISQPWNKIHQCACGCWESHRFALVITHSFYFYTIVIINFKSLL